MKIQNIFIKNSIINIISSILIQIITSIFGIYLANTLNTTDIGLYKLIMSIFIFFVSLSSSGISLAATIMISEKLSKKCDEDVLPTIKICLKYSLILGIFSALLLILFTPFICKKYFANKVTNYIFYILSFCLPFTSLSSAISGYFLAKGKIKTSSIIQIISNIFRIIIVIFLINKPHQNTNYSIIYLIIGSVLAEVLGFLLSFLFLIKDLKKYINTKRNRINKVDIKKKILKISVPIWITSIIRSGLYSIKQVLIPLRLKLSGISYETSIANYGIISSMALPTIMFAMVIISSYSFLLVPEFSKYTIDLDKEKINNKISKLFKITLYFSILVTGILMYLGKDIASIIFKNTNVGLYIKLLSPLAILIYLDNVIDSILKGLEKHTSVMIINIIDLVVSITFIYFLLPILSIKGYIIVIYISEILNYSLSLITLLKATNFTFKYTEWVILPIIYITIAIILTNLIQMNFNMSLLNLILKVICCILIYTGLLYYINRQKKRLT